MSHIHASAVVNNVSGTLWAALEISWFLPWRMSQALCARAKRALGLSTSADPPVTSLWLTLATAIFAPTLAHNWQLLLARPRVGIDGRDGLIYPPTQGDKTKSERELAKHYSQAFGFHGFLYVSHSSPAFESGTVVGADAVWIHAHGGGFYAGEARQYHHTFMRWVEKAWHEHATDLRILTVEYPLSDSQPYPGCIDAVFAAYTHVLKSGVKSSQVIIAGDSAGGNAALSTCYRLIDGSERSKLPSPVGLVMLSPWLDLTRSVSGRSPNQSTDWLTTFDSDECRVGAIEQYMGTIVRKASDPRVSPLWREPDPALPKQFLSAGQAEVLFADSDLWARKVVEALGSSAIECHFAHGQVHTFAIGGWLADPGVEVLSDWRILDFVRRQTQPLPRR